MHKETHTENKLVVAEGNEDGGISEIDKGDQEVQTSSYKNKLVMGMKSTAQGI